MDTASSPNLPTMTTIVPMLGQSRVKPKDSFIRKARRSSSQA